MNDSWLSRTAAWFKGPDSAENLTPEPHTAAEPAEQTRPFATPETEIVLRGPFTNVAGFQWRYFPAQGLPAPSDNNNFPRRSPLQLFEDGALLGPAHCIHAQIETDGTGRYSCWEGAVNFSTSDNSDPNTNGKTYVIKVGPPIFNVMTFGSCHLTFATQTLEHNDKGNRVFTGASQSHYAKEAIQHLQLYRGEVAMPDAIRRLSLTQEDDRLIGTHFNDEADATFLEICTPFQVSYRGMWLNRNLLGDGIVNPVAKLGDDALYAVTHWFYNGLLKPNEAIRAEAAAKLIGFLPQDENFEWRRDVVMEARVVRQDAADLATDIARFRDMLHTPLVLVTHTLRYMPDGRAVSWPGGFHGIVNKVGSELGLEVVNPHEFVVDQGADFSLTKEETPHYTPEFNAVLGQVLLEAGLRAKDRWGVNRRAQGVPNGGVSS